MSKLTKAKKTECLKPRRKKQSLHLQWILNMIKAHLLSNKVRRQLDDIQSVGQEKFQQQHFYHNIL